MIESRRFYDACPQRKMIHLVGLGLLFRYRKHDVQMAYAFMRLPRGRRVSNMKTMTTCLLDRYS